MGGSEGEDAGVEAGQVVGGGEHGQKGELGVGGQWLLGGGDGLERALT